MQKKYVIGLDYGTLSGRAVIVDCENGKVLAASVKNYEHGVMSENLPTGAKISGGDCSGGAGRLYRCSDYDS